MHLAPLLLFHFSGVGTIQVRIIIELALSDVEGLPHSCALRVLLSSFLADARKHLTKCSTLRSPLLFLRVGARWSTQHVLI